MAVISNIDNEKIRLTATLLNTVAAALVTIGFIVPFADTMFRDGSLRLVPLSLLWLVVAGFAHWRARRMLERMATE